ncbi:MAG: hypothetical protein FJY97_10955 [candidate division Zixibacteria bacterium]|nr:hypothetical protein [candidate division Zixibacteria bacterium]
MHRPKIMFYHDGRHPLIYMYEPPIHKEEFEAGVDELAGTPVEALMFCLGDGRTVLHDTQTGELWGHNVQNWSHPVFRRAWQNAKHLIDEGHDPLRVICDRAHKKGLLLYPTLLVQQGRGDRETDVRCSDFRFENTHLEIGARDGVDPASPAFTCLDFIHEEVRAERLALIAETVAQYPVDGFELQMNYTPHYFHPDHLEAGREIMTGWIRAVYETVKTSGTDRELVIRIPASLEGCYDAGMDVRAWIEEGIVDTLVGQAFSGPEIVHPMLNFRPLVQAAVGSNCRVFAAIQSLVDSDRTQEAPIEILRATACNYWDQGIDGLYLAHWFGNWPYQASFYEKLRELPHPDIMAVKDKFYYIPTETGRYGVPQIEAGLSMHLPAQLEKDKRVHIPFTITDDLPRWSSVGRIHEIILRLRILNMTEEDTIRIALNNQPLPDRQLRIINEMYRMKAPRYRTGSGRWFVFRLDEGTRPVKGANNLSVTLTHRVGGLKPELVLRDVELEIKYLMGKHYHRGQDPDLGSVEWWNM